MSDYAFARLLNKLQQELADHPHRDEVIALSLQQLADDTHIIEEV